MSEHIKTSEFDPHSPDHTFDTIYRTYDDLRSECPVSRGGQYGGYWAITSHELVREAALDAETFSSGSGVYLPAVSAERLPMLEMDDPEHAAYRRVLAPRFNALVAREWEPRIRQIIDSLVDGFSERGDADLVAEFTVRLPLTVIGELFGLEPERRLKVRADALRFLDNASGGADGERLFTEMVGDWEALVRERRAEPTDDLISHLVSADYGEQTVRDRDIALLMWELTFGGHDSTMLVLGSILLHLVEHPDQRRWLAEDLDRIPGAVEEFLRLYSPLHNFRRDSTRRVRLGNETIEAGDPVLLLYAAANRDPEQFPDPETARFDRANIDTHLTFGAGPHGCIGQFIARVELRVAVEAIITRLGEYQLDGPAVRTPLTGGGHHLGVARLPVRFTPSPARTSHRDEKDSST